MPPAPGKQATQIVSICVARDYREFSRHPEDWNWVDIYPGSVCGIKPGLAPAHTVNFASAAELDEWLAAYSLGRARGPLAPYYSEVYERRQPTPG